MQKITPFLWFDSEAEQAARFYVSVFKKGSKITGVARYGDSGPGPKGSVMTVAFRLAGQELTALNAGPVFKFSPAISFVVSCATQKEVDYYWQKLSSDPAAEQCGWLKDKYGLSWQIVPAILGQLMKSKDAAKSNRVMQAVLQMKKLDIEALKDAAAAGGSKQTKQSKRSK
jgi:predicted 3-demethylubiquinone-9 3-methyltransferase (glyoxalase superfamily)